MAVQTGFTVQAIFLEDYLIKDYPPPNSHIFWREGPASSRRTYGVHLYFPPGIYGEGKGSYIYWRDMAQTWWTLGHFEGEVYPHWGKALPEVNERNYQLGEIPPNFRFNDYTRNHPSSSEGSTSDGESEQDEQPGGEPTINRPRSGTIDMLTEQISSLTIAPPLYTMATATGTSTITQSTPTAPPPSQASSPPLAPASSSGSIQARLHTAMRRTTISGGLPGGGGAPGGGGGGPRGPPNPGPPIPPPPAVGQAAGDPKMMGALLAIFNGNHERANNFIKELKGYICLNNNVGGMNSYLKRIVLALTLIKGPLVANWVRDFGDFFNMLGPADDVPAAWQAFLNKFAQQFQDTQREEKAKLKLQGLRMKWPEINAYISQFEQLA
jgi:hypothetical protein